MSRASELFYNRRYRLNRAAVAADNASVSGTGLGFENSVDRNLHDAHHHHRQSQSHHRHDLDVCNPLRRSLHLRHQRVSRLELATVPHDQSNQQSASSNSMNVVEPQRNIRRPPPPVLSSSDRLPGSVLLARERLLERLRGVSLSGSRQSPGVLLRTTGNDHLFDDHWRLADASDWGAEISNRSFSSTSLRIDNLDLPPDRSDPTNGKKPPGLSQNAVDALPLEVFCCIENNVKEISKDCSICLESFMEGDKLLCLPCNHRFHSICLDPWIQICGDCPYCRKAITEAC